MVTSDPAMLAATTIGQYGDSVPALVVSPGLPLRHSATGNGFLGKTCDVLAADGPTVIRGVLREADTA